MNVYSFDNHLSTYPLAKEGSDISLTIGNFDGLHLGHLAILEELSSHNKTSVVFTFSNHPASVLHNKSIPLLSSLNHRLNLLESFGVDAVILTPFTLEFSKQSPIEFLTSLKQRIPFSSLILGHDAVIGQERLGDAAHLASIAKTLDFTIKYLDPVKVDGQAVSSSIIRLLIQEGRLFEVSKYLGRPFSIEAKVISGLSKGRTIGYPTLNLPVDNLCLPPFGVWEVSSKVRGQSQVYSGIANLGHAPTVRDDSYPLLEVHLFDFDDDMDEETLEVFFLKYIRPEKKFKDLNELKQQIKKDISFIR